MSTPKKSEGQLRMERSLHSLKADIEASTREVASRHGISLEDMEDKPKRAALSQNEAAREKTRVMDVDALLKLQGSFHKTLEENIADAQRVGVVQLLDDTEGTAHNRTCRDTNNPNLNPDTDVEARHMIRQRYLETKGAVLGSLQEASLTILPNIRVGCLSVRRRKRGGRWCGWKSQGRLWVMGMMRLRMMLQRTHMTWRKKKRVMRRVTMRVMGKVRRWLTMRKMTGRS